MKPTRTQIIAVFGALLIIGLAIPMAAANMHTSTADNETQTEDEQAAEDPPAEQQLPEQAQAPAGTPPENVTTPQMDGQGPGVQQLIQVLILISDELEEMNERLARIEAQLDAHTNETIGNDTIDNDTEPTNDTFGNETELNETVTDTTNDTDEVNDTGTNETNETNLTQSTAGVNFQGQLTAGEIVVVDWAYLPDGGYVDLHDETYLTADTPEESVASVVGSSDYLEPGNHSTVTVNLTEERWGLNGSELQQDQPLIAMPHNETTGDTSMDYVTSNGSDDGPYFVDNDPDQGPVTDDANVSVSATA